MSDLSSPFQSVPDLTSILEKYERFGIELGLERVLAVLERLGNPQRQVPVVHITGTNGKGSVCAYLSSVLAATGYKVGRYTSPHLLDWTERICINNQPIAAVQFISTLQAIEAVCSAYALTQFEVITVAAWLIFAAESVDIAIIEVGLGGRLDATNVCDRPLVSIITSISLEHWQRLGPTLADIAWEKAGILKSNCPAVIGALPPEALAVVEQRAQVLNCPLVKPEPAQWLASVNPRSRAIAQGIEYPLSLNGEIQLQNSAVAIAALQSLRQQGWEISPAAIEQGMAQTQWPGRLEWTHWDGQTLLIDGAHNPAAAKALRQYVDSLAVPSVHWIMGMLSTKDHQDIFEILLKPGDRLSLLPVMDHSSADPLELEILAQKVCPELADLSAYTRLEEALCQDGAPPNRMRVLCGSLYLIGEFLKHPLSGVSSIPQMD